MLSTDYVVVEVAGISSCEFVGAYLCVNVNIGDTVLVTNCEFDTVRVGTVKYTWESFGRTSFDHRVDTGEPTLRVIEAMLYKGIHCSALGGFISTHSSFADDLEDVINNLFPNLDESEAIIDNMVYGNCKVSCDVSFATCRDCSDDDIPYAIGELKVEITLSPECEYIYANAEEEEEVKIGNAFAKQQAEHEAEIMNDDFDYGKYINDPTLSKEALSDAMPF